MELEQPSGDSAAVEETAPAKSEADLSIFEAPPVIEDSDDTESDQAPAEDPEEEDEIDGVKLKGKKEALEKLKAERLMQADYTRKTQEAAELRKQAEVERATYQQAAAVQQTLGQEVAQIRSIDQRMAQLSQAIPTLVDSDPVQALKMHTEFTQLQALRGQVWNSATQKEQQLRAFNESEDSKRVNAAEAVVMREIKDWGPEKYRQLQEFAEAKGVDRESLRKMLINVPKSASILTDALKWRQLEQQRTKKPPTAPAPMPTTRVSGASAATTKPLSQLSDAEYIRRRREYQAKHR